MTEQSVLTRRTRKELVSEWRHHEILEAARRIFARLGYAASNVEEIAKEAGMAKGTVYLYFKSKEEVFAEVLASDTERLVNTMVEDMSAAKTFESRLTVFLNLRLNYIRNNRDFLSIYLAEFGSRGCRTGIACETFDKLFSRKFEFIRQCLEQAIARGEIRAVEVEPTAFAILDLARGFAERHLRGWAHLTLEEDVASVRSLILHGLRR
ncbi:MAG TPA: helix-turn-helix domain-containing protein [Vicinamibacterales bacterium]|nr:helix-turn-helix domain-containing protein [Vicinamibacterales bacterium]